MSFSTIQNSNRYKCVPTIIKIKPKEKNTVVVSNDDNERIAPIHFYIQGNFAAPGGIVASTQLSTNPIFMYIDTIRYNDVGTKVNFNAVKIFVQESTTKSIINVAIYNPVGTLGNATTYNGDKLCNGNITIPANTPSGFVIINVSPQGSSECSVDVSPSLTDFYFIAINAESGNPNIASFIGDGSIFSPLSESSIPIKDYCYKDTMITELPENIGVQTTLEASPGFYYELITV